MDDTSPPASTIEFWFDFASTYSYLSVMRVEDAAARHGVTVIWQPFLLGPIFETFGWHDSPFVLQPAKGRYMWQDMARQCAKYGLPWRQPSMFPRRAVLPLRVALLGADRPWGPEFCRRVMQRNFVSDQEIDSPQAVAAVLAQLGLPADLVDEAQSELNKPRLRTQTERAKDKGVFGAPTFFAHGEMFWGNDRLDEALALAGGQAR